MNVASKSTNASPAVCGSRDSIASLSAAHGESADAVLGIALASHGNLALVRAALRASSVRTPISPMIRARCCESWSHACAASAATRAGESAATSFRTAAASSGVTGSSPLTVSRARSASSHGLPRNSMALGASRDSVLRVEAKNCAELRLLHVAVGHAVRLEPLPAEHTARAGLQLSPPARWAAAHAADRTERDLDDPVPRIAQRQGGRPCVGVKYAAVKPFQLVLERFECTLQHRGVVLESDILRHTASCIARLEPTCEILGAPPASGARRALRARSR